MYHLYIEIATTLSDTQAYTPFTLTLRNCSERSRTTPNFSVSVIIPSGTVPERNGCGCHSGMVQNGSIR